MPVHDWTRVDAGIFHAFHLAWISEIQKVLNGVLLPEGYYVLAEQHAGRTIPDVLTLHASELPPEPLPLPLPPPPAVLSWPMLRPRCDANSRSIRTPGVGEA